MALAWSPKPGWTIEAAAGAITVTAGADEVFVLEDLREAVPAEVVGLWNAGVAPGRLSTAARAALDQLVLLGAVAPVPVPPAPPLAVAVAFAGTPYPALLGALHDSIDRNDAMVVAAPGDAGLVVWVRTTATLADAAEAAIAQTTTPYVFVDVAYHHTVSLGPLVVPDETACLACLAGWVAARWGDPVPPAEPEASRRAPLVAGLASVELERVAAGTSELANRTVSLDLRRWRIVDETLLRLPWCAACGDPP